MKVKAIALILFICFGPSLWANSFEEDRSRELAQQGIKLMKAKDFEGALAKFRDAQIEAPNSAELHFNIGLALYRLKRWEESRQAFENASMSSNPAIEKKSYFHLGNCAFQEGKHKEAIDFYSQALDKDADYHDAQVNREFVIRKVKELARKKKDQEEQQKQERQVIEKLKEIVKAQLQLQVTTRQLMRLADMHVEASTVALYAELLDQDPQKDGAAQGPIGKPSADDLKDAQDQFVLIQEKIKKDTSALIAEVAQKIANPQASPHGAPGGNPGGQEAPKNPEVEKLKLATPHLESAIAAMDRSLATANWAPFQLAQEEALLQLVEALDKLLDALTKLIQDEVQLLKDTLATAARFPEPKDETAPDFAANQKKRLDDLRDPSHLHAQKQEELDKIRGLIANSIDEQLKAMAEKGGAPAAGAPGQGDPKEQMAKMETALGHMNNAGTHMEYASRQLKAIEITEGVAAEKRALEELIKARAALSPPSQGGDQQQDQQDQKDNQDQKDQEDKQKGQQDQKDEGKNKQDQKDKEQGEQQDQKDQQAKQDKKSDSESKPEPKPGEEQKLSKEQAERMLKGAQQRERDRRKRDKEKGARSGGRGRVKKDW